MHLLASLEKSFGVSGTKKKKALLYPALSRSCMLSGYSVKNPI